MTLKELERIEQDLDLALYAMMKLKDRVMRTKEQIKKRGRASDR